MGRIDPGELRIYVYDRLSARGVPPPVSEIAAHFALSPNDTRRSLTDLKIGKTILVHPVTGEIWMAGPFSAVETSYRVTDGDRQWWANCAWDMFGVGIILNTPVRIDAHCTDCGEPITLECDPERAPNDDAVVHFLVPARHWYQDIGFT